MTKPMPARPSLLVFSDLDGTLLDHADYRFDAARPALDALRNRGVPLVLASSKTAAEIAPLHRALGLGETPAIVENGAGVYRPGDASAGDGDIARIVAALEQLPGDLRRAFRGFSEMDATEIAARTGLSTEAAARAKARRFSEPGVWSGDTPGLLAFREALAASGISATQGGRFLSLSFGATKADCMAGITSEVGVTHTLALGDAPNDIGMLDAADTGIIVRNDHGPGIPHLAGEDTGRIIRTAKSGPAGWNQAVLGFLDAHYGEGARSHG